MTTYITSQNLWGQQKFYTDDLIPKDEGDVLLDEIKEIRKLQAQMKQQEEQAAAAESQNGPINRGVDSIHALMQSKRIMDDNQLAGKLFDLDRRGVDQDTTNIILSLIA